MNEGGLLHEALLEVDDRSLQLGFDVSCELFLLDDLVAESALHVTHVLEELDLKFADAGDRHVIKTTGVTRENDDDLVDHFEWLELRLFEQFDHAIATVEAALGGGIEAMNEFYRAYRENGSAAEALRTAQLKMRAAGTSSVWSSFVVRANEFP